MKENSPVFKSKYLKCDLLNTRPYAGNSLRRGHFERKLSPISIMKEICLTKPYFKEDKIVRREKNIAEIMNNYFINITNKRERTK